MIKRGWGRLISQIIAVGDIVCINLVFIISYYAFPDAFTEPFNQKLVWVILNISYIPIYVIFAGKNDQRIIYIDQLFIATTKIVLILFLTLVTLSTLMEVDLPTEVLLLYMLELFLALNLWRIAVNRTLKLFRRRGYNFKRVVIVGAGKTGQLLYNELQSDASYGYKFMGFFDDNSEPDTEVRDLCIGTTAEVESYCLKENIDEIYCALPGSADALIVELMQMSERNTIRFFILPEFRRYVKRRLNFKMLGAVPILSIREEPLQGVFGRLSKRFMDVFISSIVLLLSPIWCLPIAILVKLSSPGNVFFSQERTGYLGKTFNCLKFRTMRKNKECDTIQASRGDARITKVGAFLRKTSLDELPQFINIFLGDMSIVGPRPHMLKHTDEYSKIIDRYMVRHFVKPGLTGWAQVLGYRGETKEVSQMERRVEADIWYLEHWNILLDLKIMLLTVKCVFKGDDNAF